jgi:hypothetical protein
MKATAGAAPNSTWDAPVNPLPVTMTAVLPDVGPEVGLRPVTVGEPAEV